MCQFLTIPMAISTCTLTEAMKTISSVFFAVNCALVPLKGRIFRVTPGGGIFLISKPRSAMILSPSSKSDRTPELRVISLSETFPDHNLDTNVMYPAGEIPTRALNCDGIFLHTRP